MGGSGFEPISLDCVSNTAGRMLASFVARVVKQLRHARTISVLDLSVPCDGEGGWRVCLPRGERALDRGVRKS
eukprot:7649353-Pyramimonas_sp.AAC.1